MEAEGNSFLKMTGRGMYIPSFPRLCSLFLCPLFLGERQCPYPHFQSFAEGGNLSDCCICPKKLRSVHDVRDPMVLPTTNFFLVPNATVDHTQKPKDVN